MVYPDITNIAAMAEVVVLIIRCVAGQAPILSARCGGALKLNGTYLRISVYFITLLFKFVLLLPVSYIE